MLDTRTIDVEITRMYTTGESTTAISKQLGLRTIDVISRVRALNLQPPGMSFRRPATEAGFEPEIQTQEAPALPSPAPADPHPVAQPSVPATPFPVRDCDARPERRRRRAPSPVAADEFDDESEDLTVLPGRPRGWLMGEAEMLALFARHRTRFEDVRLKTSR